MIKFINLIVKIIYVFFERKKKQKTFMYDVKLFYL